jgi:integral membrane sensor domain MASE1
VILVALIALIGGVAVAWLGYWLRAASWQSWVIMWISIVLAICAGGPFWLGRVAHNDLRGQMIGFAVEGRTLELAADESCARHDR